MDIHDFIEKNNNSIKKTIKELDKLSVNIEDDHGAKYFHFICNNCGLIECSDTITIFELEMNIPDEILNYLEDFK
ncbi:MAG: hypothetical protein ACFFDB_00695 [Promethearchaeota archaeon]